MDALNSSLVRAREISRAVNKTDMFRILRMTAKEHAIDRFILFDIELLESPEEYRDGIILDSTPIEDLKPTSDPVRQDVLDFVSGDSLRYWSRSESTDDDAPRAFSFDTAFAVVVSLPLKVKDGRQFALTLFRIEDFRHASDLARVVHDFMSCLMQIDPAVLEPSRKPKLAKREIEVSAWTSYGKTSAEIAVILGLSEYTVNEYITGAMRKLGAINRMQLVANAIRCGAI